MDIDLLMTDRREPGILCNDEFTSSVAGVMFDADSRQLTVEFSDMDSIDLNIPVEEEHIQALLYSQSMQIATIKQGMITSSRQVPVLLLNDPYGAPATQPQKASDSVLQFESFLKRCTAGQPIHREDLGNEETMDSVMSGTNAAALQFAPQLARQRSLEAAPRAPAPKGPAPAAPGPSGMGGSGGGGGFVPPPQTNNEDWEE